MAEQTNKQIELFKKKLSSPGVSELLCVGGIPAKEQVAGLQRGVDIVCGTPGRIEDLATGSLDLSQVRFFVLDEAVRIISWEV